MLRFILINMFIFTHFMAGAQSLKQKQKYFEGQYRAYGEIISILKLDTIFVDETLYLDEDKLNKGRKNKKIYEVKYKINKLRDKITEYFKEKKIFVRGSSSAGTSSVEVVSKKERERAKIDSFEVVKINNEREREKNDSLEMIIKINEGRERAKIDSFEMMIKINEGHERAKIDSFEVVIKINEGRERAKIDSLEMVIKINEGHERAKIDSLEMVISTLITKKDRKLRECNEKMEVVKNEYNDVEIERDSLIVKVRHHNEECKKIHKKQARLLESTLEKCKEEKVKFNKEINYYRYVSNECKEEKAKFKRERDYCEQQQKETQIGHKKIIQELETYNHYYDAKYQAGEPLITDKKGLYFKIELKTPPIIVEKLQFNIEKYTISEFDKKFRKSVTKFKQDVEDITSENGNLDYEIFIQGKADADIGTQFEKPQVENYMFNSIYVLRRNQSNNNQFTFNKKLFLLNNPYRNNDLPNLRGAFIKKVLNSPPNGFPKSKLHVLNGDVVDEINPTERSVTIYLYIDTVINDN